MAGLTARLVAFLEDRLRIPPLERAGVKPGDHAIRTPVTIAIVGGGLAGPAFARRALALAGKLGLEPRLELFTRPACNYCAGLITDLARQTMNRLYGLPVPANIVREDIREVVYLNRRTAVTIPLAVPLTSVLRTSRFRQQAFDDTWLDSVFRGLGAHSRFTAHRNTRVTRIARIGQPTGFRVFYETGGTPFSLEVDLVVLASGLKSLQQPFMRAFMSEFGYTPPDLMDASVTEINTARASFHDLGGRVLVADGIVPDCIVAFIPKGRDWLTLTGLGKVLADHDLEALFNHPLVGRHLLLDNVTESLRCGKICSAGVVERPGGTIAGDGWVAIGDLAGYGRALKDGYFAALQTADLAARTMLCHGQTAADFQRHYVKPLRKLDFDNRLGMLLYRLDQKLINGPVGDYLLATARAELERDPYGGLVTAAFRALFSGELSYQAILALFVGGLALGACRNPPVPLTVRPAS